MIRTGFLIAVLLCAQFANAAFNGRVVDATSHKPIAGATISVAGVPVTAGPDGRFQLRDTTESVSVRASGYRQTQVNPSLFKDPKNATPDIALTPFRARALYLTVYGIGSLALRNSALALAARKGLNALVIDVKGDRGLVPYHSSVPLAVEAGANKVITVKDIHSLIQDLHGRGLYLIGRLVVFKDNPLAELKPELALKGADGKTWHDKEGLAWTDPTKKEVWDYTTDLAVEAAKNGFDEIQFDYVRFPDAPGATYSVANTEENRTGALSGFLTEARTKLAPYNVYMAADIFGYTAWNLNDTHIGQKIEKLGPLLDYLCPMLYPSGFQFGIPGFRNPVANPYEIVKLSLDQAAKRTALPATHFRPWLQAFRDYGFDRRIFGATEISAQIKAADDFGSGGWMLWNPRNAYTADGLP